MSPITIIIIILSYFGLLFAVSYITNRKADNQSFFIGNRKSPWYVVAIGMIGASLSGVTFVSVPGWVIDSQFYYMQIVFGYLLGYSAIVFILLPVYYRLQLTSIYTYLENRFGPVSYKTGSVLFLISRIIGASFRLFLVANVLQLVVFDAINVHFSITVLITLGLIWVYTFKGGIKTIVWTDTLQTAFMLISMGLSMFFIVKALGLDAGGAVRQIKESGYSTIFNFNDWQKGSFFFKQFLSGAFITIVMTGLDQDMMQKNLSCRNLKDAQKNMLSYGLAFVPVNLLSLSLGVLLVVFADKNGLMLPNRTDDLFPMVVNSGLLPPLVMVLFILGLIAAAYSSADSALTSLTTSFTIDILGTKNKTEKEIKTTRMVVHGGMTFILFLVIIIFKYKIEESVISSLFKAAGYTYGPLLGLYTFGLFSKRKIKEVFVPVIALVSPVLCYILNTYSEQWLWGYKFGFEILLVNGFLVLLGLVAISTKKG